jgi:hypothetical protein
LNQVIKLIQTILWRSYRECAVLRCDASASITKNCVYLKLGWVMRSVCVYPLRRRIKMPLQFSSWGRSVWNCIGLKNK